MPLRHLVAIAVLVLPGPLQAAERALIPMTVRVYDSAGLAESVLAAALTVAQRPLDSADIDTVWRHCNGESAAGACGAPLSQGELVIRIVPRRRMLASGRLLTLGDALIEKPSGEGKLATIYFDCVQLLARASAMEVSRLLGYAIAHELGHLLLATSTHARSGLMRAVWPDTYVRGARDDDWRFTDREIATIRARRLTTRMVDIVP